ncbi:hypothetical protein PP836_004915 [Salmonella enterica]|nr:hypothetical protein [Salmonella enterica subsp. diarizonae]EGV3635705.1 hypothetical protein [Salmonella enterica]EKL0444792.1 hypothetical protein [Salmonella enterica]HCM1888535.1 hypothetical protein [Salmonella enterica subsp. diarizonae serovar 57:c:z]
MHNKEHLLTVTLPVEEDGSGEFLVQVVNGKVRLRALRSDEFVTCFNAIIDSLRMTGIQVIIPA